MDTPSEALPLEEIVRSYPNQWVLVEETAWDSHGHPIAGMVRAASVARGDLREPVRRCHHNRSVTTFLFYTGDPIPAARESGLLLVCSRCDPLTVGFAAAANPKTA